MAFELPALPYANDALEPFIDAQTMEIHHDKHHAAYVANFNAAIEGTEFAGLSIEAILAKGADKLPPAVRNNGGGHANHSLFWTLMGPNKGGEPKGEIAGAIDSTFGGFAAFKEKFETAAKTRFGSGWAWLSLSAGQLEVTSTANQDTPVLEGNIPLLTLDVWEHAYYLKYQNRRPEYISNWWNVVDWEKVNSIYVAAK
ncbi:MAG: superoxide dismutase [Armatimonadota bacterium]